MNNIIPQGDVLRQLLAKSSTSEANINSLLREKGVFLSVGDKNVSVPLLMKSIISPKDFFFLSEIQKKKEDTIKYRTISIKCSRDFDWPDIIDNVDINKLIVNNHTYKPNYSVIGQPNFYYENDLNTAVLDYLIERENLLSDMYNSKTTHKGSIILNKRKISDNEIQVSIQHNFTTKETLEVNDILIGGLKKKLKDSSIINSNNDIITIRFNSFDNTNRIQFFYSFIQDFSIYMSFKSITDINLYFDENIESHKDIKDFLNKLDNLKLNGRELQDHILVTNKEYYPKLIFATIKLKYSFDINGIKGITWVNIGFPDYIRSKNEFSEFQMSIEINLDKEFKKRGDEKEVRKKVLDILEKIKVESYDKFKFENQL